jgi:hypothetical protein
MADHTDNALAASVKALTDVVLPALGTSDPVASEQLRLVIGFLTFMRSRLPMQEARRRFELGHYLNVARSIADDARLASSEVCNRLDNATASARKLLDDPAASGEDIAATAAELSAVLSALVRVVAAGDGELRQRVERAVLLAAQSLIDAQRAWYLPMGFDLEPANLPSLDKALAFAR